ncbi:uncharacterized protein LOC124316081 [Daphnia pulicaria]|uniref:uncharacterized protein LOC124316081 n=1 Tax=Daphnia pulicaria TaxID=35523 RepID=UPI001EEA86C5|nr:uncharacterized protein LOC124316081 [Daphnia pulicaria]
MNPALLVNVIFVLVIASPVARSQPLRPNGNHSDLPDSISFAVSEVHEVAPIAEAATDAVPEIAVVAEEEVLVVVPETEPVVEQVVVVPEPEAVVEQVVVT